MTDQQTPDGNERFDDFNKDLSLFISEQQEQHPNFNYDVITYTVDETITLHVNIESPQYTIVHRAPDFSEKNAHYAYLAETLNYLDSIAKENGAEMRSLEEVIEAENLTHPELSLRSSLHKLRRIYTHRIQSSLLGGEVSRENLILNFTCSFILR